LKSIITFCAFALLCAAAHADTIVLKNGDRIQADSAQERNGRVEYTLGDNTMTIPKSIVVRIEKGPAYGPSPSSVAATPEAPPIHFPHKTNRAITNRDVQVFHHDGNLAYLVNVFSVKSGIKQLTVKRHRPGLRRRRLSPSGNIPQRKSKAET